ncbi:MAG TPA: PaaI family thioesterase [Rubrivivax sp.]|nr:PaaI family thioesterase [Rubrivivax sp.]
MNAEATLAAWNEELQAVRRRAAAARPGVAAPEQLQSKSGLQIMQAMLAGELPYPHIMQTLDYALVQIDKGKAVFQGVPQLMHYNPLGSVHGGWYATLLDSAMGCAVHTALQAGQAYTTAELGIHIVRAASLKSGPLRAIGQTVHVGRQLATAEARIVGADGKLYAHGSTTCLVFEAR